MNTEHKFELIEGGRSNDQALFHRLMAEPQSFDQSELERLIDLFKDRLSLQEKMDIIERSIRHGRNANDLENRALLAVIEGDRNKIEHLFDVIKQYICLCNRFWMSCNF